jgi:hypothetical protein
MRSKEREQWMALIEKEREAHRQEVASLLDRIQHPEVRQVQAGEPVEYEPPRDLAELAQVGQVVPDGYDVGANSTGENHAATD